MKRRGRPRHTHAIRSTLRPFGIVAIIFVTLMGVAVPSGAQDVRDTEPTIFVHQAAVASQSQVSTLPVAGEPAAPTAAELEDLAVIAADKGISLQQAVAEYGWRHHFAMAVDDLRRAYPDTFADAGSDGGQAWIAFKGTSPPETAAVLRSTPVPVEVREHVGWSEAELVATAEKIHYALLADKTLTMDVATDSDTTRGHIRVSIKPAGVPLANARAYIAGALTRNTDLRAAVAAVPSTVEVSVVVDTGVEGGVDTVYGGGLLTSGGGGGSDCTAGFPVTRLSNTSHHGLSTARHCDPPRTYAGRDALSNMTALSKSDGDARWLISSEAVGNQFYYAPGSRRAVTGQLNPLPGSPVCKYGAATGQTCDEVYKTNQCRDDYCGLTMTHRRNARGGDSGGPWYYGNTALGIHSGWKWHRLLRRDMFTPARTAHDGLGVRVKIS